MSPDGKSVKLTSKRQVTFPQSVCDDLGVSAGDRLILRRTIVDNEVVWTITPSGKRRSWLGALQPYSQGKRHAMAAVRESVASERGRRRS